MAAALPKGWKSIVIEAGGPVSGWDVSGDGSTVMVWPKKKSFRLFDRSGKEIAAPKKVCGPVLDRDGKRLAAAGPTGPILFESAGKRGWKTVTFGGGWTLGLQFTPTGQLGGTSTTGIRIWSLKNASDGLPPIVDELGAQGKAQCSAAAFHPSGAEASLAFKSKVRTFELSSGLELAARDVDAPVDPLKWTSDGKWLMGLFRHPLKGRAYFWPSKASKPKTLAFERGVFPSELTTFGGAPAVLVGVDGGAAQLRDASGRVVLELPTPFERPYGSVSADGRTVVLSRSMEHRVIVFAG